MEFKPFSVVNQFLKEKLILASRYSNKEISLLKIFQHALSFAIVGNDEKLIKNYLHLPLFVQIFIYRLKGWTRRNNKTSVKLKSTVILDPVRLVKDENGVYRSIYFDRVVSALGRENVSVLHQRSSDLIKGDYDVTQLDRNWPALDEIEKGVLEKVIAIVKRNNSFHYYTTYEKKHILSALHIFFEDFRFYYQLFKGQSVERLIFICHYHNEGLLAAARALNIFSIELQHGLIAGNDLYYVYHEQFAGSVQNAFFPDRILVYGQYWKGILEKGCEFRPKQIFIGGDYLFRLEEHQMLPVQKENLILICAQKTLHEDYVGYGRMLAKHMQNNPDWKVIVKLHPLEKNKEEYNELLKYGFEIVDLEWPLDVLLSRCKIQISIYSTTFFDAVGYGVVNFSIQHFGASSDYAADMVTEGVALPLTVEQDPIKAYNDVLMQQQPTLGREDVYAPFDIDAFVDMLKIPGNTY
jgi:hypothetical protein